ncbi:MAG: hypothetical protein MJZ34_08085 [Paludibacteraceae bacterium]|nr:hypothetical protein [Paludibacteraceae bacterium]
MEKCHFVSFFKFIYIYLMHFGFITPHKEYKDWVLENIGKSKDEITKKLNGYDRIKVLHLTIAVVMYCYENIEEDLNKTMDLLLEPFLYQLKYRFYYRKNEIKEIIKRGKELTPKGLVEMNRNTKKEIMMENLKKLSKGSI